MCKTRVKETRAHKTWKPVIESLKPLSILARLFACPILAEHKGLTKTNPNGTRCPHYSTLVPLTHAQRCTARQTGTGQSAQTADTIWSCGLPALASQSEMEEE